MRIRPSLRQFSALCILLAAAGTSHAETVDCAAIMARAATIKDCRKDVEMDYKKVKQCVLRGYDAPKTCRNNEGLSSGVSVGGSTGFSYGTIQSPQTPPGATNAPPSVSPQVMNQAFGNTNPWPGAPCVLPGGINLCALGQTATPVPDNSLCPAQSTNTTIYGVKTPISSSGAANLSLTCGGALPLTYYETTLNRNPTRLASTEFDSYELYLYKKGTSNYVSATSSEFQMVAPVAPTSSDPWYLGYVPPVPTPIVNGNPIPLPRFLCNDSGKKTVDLPPAISQFITYSPTSPNIAIRLKSRATLSPTTSIPPYNENDPEKYLILPIVNGRVQVPRTCAKEADFYKTLDNAAQAEIAIESATVGGCEGTAAQCNGAPPAPTPSQACALVSLNLTPLPSVPATSVCAGKIQHVVLDRANLVYPVNTTASMARIAGRTAVLAPTTEGSRIYMQTNGYIRLGNTAPPITLNEGGLLQLSNGNKLSMIGPVTINAATDQITLTGGGMILSQSGAMVGNSLPAGSSYSLAAAAAHPLTIRLNRSINMPVNYMVPTQPQPYVRMPTP